MSARFVGRCRAAFQSTPTVHQSVEDTVALSLWLRIGKSSQKKYAQITGLAPEQTGRAVESDRRQ
ncbi:hypothetical protein HAV15_004470 [Penicillium sp. str. |nr:hypothetical protein HAV15_004470 [Penicillium sp. str. \